MPVTREQFIAEAKKRGFDTSKFEQGQSQAQGGGVKELLGGIFNRLPGAVATATGTQIQKDPNDTTDDYSKLYAQEAIKRYFEPQEGYASESEIPQEVGGLPVKTITNKRGRYVPTYGKSQPLVNFGDMDNMIEGMNGEELPESQTLEEPSGMTIEDLESMKQQALSEGRDTQEVEAIYQEELQKINGGGSDLIGDISEFDIDESDRQYLIQQGYDPEMVDNVLSKAVARKGSNGGR